MFEKMKPEEIRKHKGKSFVGVATAVAIFNEKGQLLLAKRSKNCRDEHGKWDICGGGLELNNTVELNLREEMQEEFNVASSQPTYFVGIREAFRIDENGDETHWLSLDHIIILTDEEADNIKINEPHKFDDIGWFELRNLPSPLHSQITKDYLDKLKLKFNEVRALSF